MFIHVWRRSLPFLDATTSIGKKFICLEVEIVLDNGQISTWKWYSPLAIWKHSWFFPMFLTIFFATCFLHVWGWHSSHNRTRECRLILLVTIADREVLVMSLKYGFPYLHLSLLSLASGSLRSPYSIFLSCLFVPSSLHFSSFCAKLG